MTISFDDAFAAIPDQAETVTWERPSVWIIDEASGRSLRFAAPGDDRANAQGELHIQPGTFNIQETANGNKLVQFQVFYRRTATEVDPKIHDNVNDFNRLMGIAERVQNGLSFGRVVIRTQKKFDGDGYRESAVVSGSILEIDNSVPSRWYDKDSIVYQVQVETLPFSERPYGFLTVNQTVSSTGIYTTGINCHGGVVRLGKAGGSGTTGGRIRSMSIYPSKTAQHQWRNLWIGIKPNLTPDGKIVNITSQVKVDSDTALPPVIGDIRATLISGTEFINSEGVSVGFTDEQGWQTRFFVPSSRWSADFQTYHVRHMPGMYRLLARLEMPEPGRRADSTYQKWGVRARTVFDRGLIEYYEIERTPEIIIPDARIGDGQYPAYYDLGNIKIGHDYYLGQRTELGALALAVDAALLGVELLEDGTIVLGGGRTGRASTGYDEIYLIFDDFRLVPMDSFIRVSLPKLINGTNERLEIYIDDFDKPHAVVTLNQLDTRKTIQYEVTDIEVGPNGFFMPPYDYNEMVVVADAGPDNAIATDATISRIDIDFKQREYGGLL